MQIAQAIEIVQEFIFKPNRKWTRVLVASYHIMMNAAIHGKLKTKSPKKKILEPIIPLTKEISPGSIESLFTAEITFCMKTFEAYSIKHSSTTKYRFSVIQFLDCINKFERKISATFLAKTLILCGETLLDLYRFHEIARIHCLEKAKILLESSPTTPFPTAAEISSSNAIADRPDKAQFTLYSNLVFGIQNAKFLALISKDFGLKNEKSITQLNQIFESFQKYFNTLNVTPIKMVDLFYCVYNTIQMAQFAQARNSILQVSLQIEWLIGTLHYFEPLLAFKIFISLHRIFRLENSPLYEKNLETALNYFSEKANNNLDLVSGSIQRRISAIYCGNAIREEKQDSIQHLHNLYRSLSTRKHQSLSVFEISWKELASNYSIPKRGIFGKKQLFSYDLVPYFQKKCSPENFETYLKLLRYQYPNWEPSQTLHVDIADPDMTEGNLEERADLESAKTKKRIIKEESEDEKRKKKWAVEFTTAIEPFDPSEQITVIVQSLGNLMGFEQRLSFYEKELEMNDFIIDNLLTFANNILNEYTSFKLKKRQHFEDDEISVEEMLEFQLHEIHALGNYFFQKKHWNGLNTISNYFENIKANENVKNCHLMRIAAARLVVSIQADRKVSFVANLEGRATPTDIIKSQFDLTEDIGNKATAVCQILLFALTSKTFINDNAGLVLDVLNLMWTFLEPFIRDFSTANENNRIESLPPDSPLFLLYLILNAAYNQFSYFKDLKHFYISIGISKKLGVLLLAQSQFDLSSQIFFEILETIEHAFDKILGISGNEINCITSDLSFHESLYTTLQGVETTYNSNLFSLYVDFLCDYFKSELKRLKAEELVELDRLAQSDKVLRHKVVKRRRTYRFKNEDTVLRICGYDPAKRALFYMSVLAVEALTENEVTSYLTKARDSLIQAKEYEHQLLVHTKAQNHFFPEIIHKSTTSITLSIPHHAESTDYQLIGNFGYGHSDICGVKIRFPHFIADPDEITLFGIEPNDHFTLKIQYYSQEGASTTLPVKLYGSVPISLLLSWTYLASVAQLNEHPEIFSQSCETLEDHFKYFKTAEDNYILSGNFQMFTQKEFLPFTLNESLLANCDLAVVRGFINCIFTCIRNRIEHFRNSDIRRPLRASQLLRIKNAADYHAAAFCAKVAGESKCELLCIIKLFKELQPIIEDNVDIPFVTYLLLICHETIIRNSSYFGDDRTQGVRHYMIPLTYVLTQKLIQNGENTLCSKIAHETISLITLTSYSPENKIFNSSAIEINALGYLYKPAKGNGKKHYIQMLQEFGFHSQIAVTKGPTHGIPSHPRPFDTFYENIELLLAQNKLGFPALTIDSSKKFGASSTKKTTIEHFTTMKEIYNLQSSGTFDLVINELSKFRKNPRYVEILATIVAWCVDKENIDSAVKFSTELEDYVDKRMQTILKTDELLMDSAQTKKDFTIKRRKRMLFTVSASLEINPKRKARANLTVTNEAPKSAGAHLLIGINDRKTILSAGDAQSITKIVPEKKPIVTQDADSSGTGTDSFSNGSHSSKEKGRASSPGQSAQTSSEGADVMAASKKKKAQFRHLLFTGKSPAERDRVEQALKVLENQLPDLWHRKRYLRRIRALLAYENPWRAKALVQRGIALLLQLQKDTKFNNSYPIYDMEWFEFRLSFCVFFDTLMNGDNIVLSPESYEVNNGQLIDMLQSYIQSIVLASRCQNHLQVLANSRLLWNALRYLIHSGKLNHEFWQICLWRGLEVAALSILESLKSMQIRKLIRSNTFLHKFHEFYGSIDNTFESIMGMYQHEFVGEWVDQSTGLQIHSIDIVFCSEFLLFTVETMYLSKKINRIQALQVQMKIVFGNIHDPIINPLLHLESNNESHFTDSLWITCRCLATKIILDQTRSAIVTPELKEEQSYCIKLYEQILQRLEKDEDSMQKVKLCTELANFLFEIGNRAGAAVYWSLSLDYISNGVKFIQNWPNVLSLDLQKPITLKNAMKNINFFEGPTKTIFAAIIVTKLARFVYHANHDKNYELVWLAVNLIYSCLITAPNYPQHPYDFIDFVCTSFLRRKKLFVDKYFLNPSTFIKDIQYLIIRLKTMNMNYLAIPLCSLTKSICISYLDSYEILSRMEVLKVLTLNDLGLVNEAISLYTLIIRKLGGKQFTGELSFDIQTYPFTTAHFHQLKAFLNFPIGEKAKEYYSPTFVYKLELTRIQLVLDILYQSNKNQMVTFDNTSEKSNEKPTNESEKPEKSKCQSDSSKLLDSCQISLVRIITELQQIIKNDITSPDESINASRDWKAFASNYRLLYRSTLLLASVFYLQSKFEFAIKCCTSILEKLEAMKSLKFGESALYSQVKAFLGQEFFFGIREIIIKSLISTRKFGEALRAAQNSLPVYVSLKSNFHICKILLWVAYIFLEDESLLHPNEIESNVRFLIYSIQNIKISAMLQILIPDFLTVAKQLKNRERTAPLFNQSSNFLAQLQELLKESQIVKADRKTAIVQNNPVHNLALAGLTEIICTGEYSETKLRTDFEEYFAMITHPEFTMNWSQRIEIICMIGSSIFLDRLQWDPRSRKFGLFCEFAQQFMLKCLEILFDSKIFDPSLFLHIYTVLFTIEYEKGFGQPSWEYMRSISKLYMVKMLEKSAPDQIIDAKTIPSDLELPIKEIIQTRPLQTSFSKDILELNVTDFNPPGELAISEVEFFKYKHFTEDYFKTQPLLCGVRSINARNCYKKVIYALQNACPQLYGNHLFEGDKDEEGDSVMVGWLPMASLKKENDISWPVFNQIRELLEAKEPKENSQKHKRANSLVKHSGKLTTLVLFIKKNSIESKVIRNISERHLKQITLMTKKVLIFLGYYQTTNVKTFATDTQGLWRNILHVLRLVVSKNISAKQLPDLTVRNASIILEILNTAAFVGFGRGFQPVAIPHRNPFIINKEAVAIAKDYDGKQEDDSILIDYLIS